MFEGGPAVLFPLFMFERPSWCSGGKVKCAIVHLGLCHPGKGSSRDIYLSNCHSMGFDKILQKWWTGPRQERLGLSWKEGISVLSG